MSALLENVSKDFVIQDLITDGRNPRVLLIIIMIITHITNIYFSYIIIINTNII